MFARVTICRTLIVVALVVPASVVTLFAYWSDSATLSGSKLTQKGCGVTTEGYTRIHHGMTLEEVQTLLGEAGEVVEGFSYPYCPYGSPASIRGRWRIWRDPQHTDRWVAAKFSESRGVVIDKAKEGLELGELAEQRLLDRGGMTPYRDNEYLQQVSSIVPSSG